MIRSHAIVWLMLHVITCMRHAWSCMACDGRRGHMQKLHTDSMQCVSTMKLMMQDKHVNAMTLDHQWPVVTSRADRRKTLHDARGS